MFVLKARVAAIIPVAMLLALVVAPSISSAHERRTLGGGKFHKVEAASAVECPIAAPEPAQVTADLQVARATAQSAQTIAMAGVGVGVLGLLVAVGVWLTRPRGRPVTVSTRRAAGERLS